MVIAGPTSLERVAEGDDRSDRGRATRADGQGPQHMSLDGATITPGREAATRAKYIPTSTKARRR